MAVLLCPQIGHQCRGGSCHLKPVPVSERMRGIVPAIKGPVSSFEAWVPADLQSRQLLYGTLGYEQLPAMDEGQHGQQATLITPRPAMASRRPRLPHRTL